MILSQYKRKVFVKLGQHIKPVIMLEVKLSKDNKANYEVSKSVLQHSNYLILAILEIEQRKICWRLLIIFNQMV